jgi:hypothetical protein
LLGQAQTIDPGTWNGEAPLTNDGKQLEGLVAIVEKLLLPNGFEVKTNERVVGDDGVQIAEFDIEITGKVGTTTIHWLIECRDRPGQGAAPGSWIEQLVGRRGRFGFNKVTAVSTTGFASAAAAYALEEGIELREVRSLAATEFADWLQVKTMTQRLRISLLAHANIVLDSEGGIERKFAAADVIKNAGAEDALLVSTTSGEAVTPAQAFSKALHQLPNAFETVSPDRPRQVRLLVEYPTPDHYCIITHEGDARVHAIEFVGELRIQETSYPVVSTVEYRHFETGEPISQVATFAPQVLAGAKLSFELHRIAESGQIHVSMRSTPDKA